MERMICIENLHPEADVSNLCSKFRKFGRILTASIDVDEHFTSLCKGHVLFENSLSTKEAMAEMNGVKLMGKPLVVRKAAKKINPDNAGKKYTKLFVKNIDLDWDECDFMEAFKKFGEIADSQISMTDDISNGYGFIIFKEHSAAKVAIEEMNGQVFGEKILKVEPYLPRELRESLNKNSLTYAKDLLEKSTQRNNLHIKNLPKNFDECQLRKLFETFGSITSAKIARNEDKESRGFGFVAYNSEKDAETARFRMNGFSLNSQILEVNFKQSKEERQHYLGLLKEGNPIMKYSMKPPCRKSTALNSRVSEPLFSYRCKR